MDRYFTLSFAALALLLIFSAWAYTALPEKVATHWNANGVADGFSSKESVFLIPLLGAGLLVLFYFIPRLDPLGKNIAKFREEYYKFVFAFSLFFAYLGALSIAFNLKWVSEFNLFFAPAIAFLFWNVGNLLEKSKRSWFIGIRTPWTLSSDRVWEKTNAIGGKLFKAFAIVFLVGMLMFPQTLMPLIIALLIAVVAFSFVYSYLEWKKESTGKKG